jgi:hypothetical protein
MKRLIISATAAIIVLAGATTILWSHTPSMRRSVGVAANTSLQGPRAAAEAGKLPIDEYEDMSLVYSTAPKR